MEAVKPAVDFFRSQDCDVIILGCTHYPLLRSTVGRIMGDKVTLINPAYETAMRLKELLEDKNLKFDGKLDMDENEKYEFYVSDAGGKFRTFANSILPFDIDTITQVEIEEYIV